MHTEYKMLTDLVICLVRMHVPQFKFTKIFDMVNKVWSV